MADDHNLGYLFRSIVTFSDMIPTFPKLINTLRETNRSWLADWPYHILILVGLTGLLSITGYTLSTSGVGAGLMDFYVTHNGWLLELGIMELLLLLTSGVIFAKRLDKKLEIGSWNIFNTIFMAIIYALLVMVPFLLLNLLQLLPSFGSSVLWIIGALVAFSGIIIVLALLIEWMYIPVLALIRNTSTKELIKENNTFIQTDFLDKLIHFIGILIYYGIIFFIVFILALSFSGLLRGVDAVSTTVNLGSIVTITDFLNFWMQSILVYLAISLMVCGLITLVHDFYYNEHPKAAAALAAKSTVKKKAPAKKRVTRKAAPKKKTVVKKASTTTTSTSTAKKTATKKPAAKKAPAKKAPAKKTTTKTTAKKAPAKKPAAKKTTTKKPAAKKAPAKKAPAKKTASKTTAKKAPAKKK